MKSMHCSTVGHSNRSLDDFVALLAAHRITSIIDIRSVPYSRFNPQFNRESLKTDLQLHDIGYTFLGNLLGARYDDPELLLPGGGVDFGRVRLLETFNDGIQNLLDAVRSGQTVAIMCAEKDPFFCHRFLLVARELSRRGTSVDHILEPLRAVTQHDLEERLVKEYFDGPAQPGLFDDPPKSREERLDEAYRQRNAALAAKDASRR